MIRAAAITICLLVLGDSLVEATALPLPGSALGLLCLSVFLGMRRGGDDGLSSLFDFAAPYFPLFFVPAAVGVIASIDVLIGAWLEIVVAVTVGTALALVATGGIAQWLMTARRKEVRT